MREVASLAAMMNADLNSVPDEALGLERELLERKVRALKFGITARLLAQY